MALSTPTLLHVRGVEDVGSSSTTLPSITPTAGALVVILVSGMQDGTSSGQGPFDGSPDITSTGDITSWDDTYPGSPIGDWWTVDQAVAWAIAPGSTSGTTITVTFNSGGNGMGMGLIQVIEFPSGYDATTPLTGITLQGDTAQNSSASFTLGATPDTADCVLAWTCADSNNPDDAAQNDGSTTLWNHATHGYDSGNLTYTAAQVTYRTGSASTTVSWSDVDDDANPNYTGMQSAVIVQASTATPVQGSATSSSTSGTTATGADIATGQATSSSTSGTTAAGADIVKVQATSSSTSSSTGSASVMGTVSGSADSSSTSTSTVTAARTLRNNAATSSSTSGTTAAGADIAKGSATSSSTSSTVATGSTATLPDAPTNLVAAHGAGGVVLTWDTPADDGGSAITGYLIEYNQDSGGWNTWVGADTMNPDPTEALAGDVQQWWHSGYGDLSVSLGYEWRVSAINSIGTGSPSSSTTQAVPYDTPFPEDVQIDTVLATNDTRYLIDQDSTAWMGVGDVGWSAANMLTRAEVIEWIEDRATKGANAVVVNAPEPYYADTSQGGKENQYGEFPWTGTNFASALNDSYWIHVDFILAYAMVYGITVWLCPQYLGFSDTDGWGDEMTARSDAECADYGTRLAARYGASNRPNIVWFLGHDRSSPSAAHASRTRAIYDGTTSDGLKSTGHLISCGGYQGSIQSGVDYWTNTGEFSESDFDFDSWYSYDIGTQRVQAMMEEAAGTTGLPYGFFEGYYEQEQGSAVQRREQSWATVFHGGTYAFFGNNPIWHFESGKEIYGYSGTWESNLDSDGSDDNLDNLSGFLTTIAAAGLNWWELGPDADDDFVTSPTGDRACRWAAGKGAIVYARATSTLTFNLTVLGEDKVDIWSYDPTSQTLNQEENGLSTSGQSAYTGLASFGTNNDGDDDWAFYIVYIAAVQGSATSSSTSGSSGTASVVHTGSATSSSTSGATATAKAVVKVSATSDATSSTTADGSASSAVSGSATSDSQSSETVAAKVVTNASGTSDATSSTTAGAKAVVKVAASSDATSSETTTGKAVVKVTATSDATSSTTADGSTSGAVSGSATSDSQSSETLTAQRTAKVAATSDSTATSAGVASVVTPVSATSDSTSSTTAAGNRVAIGQVASSSTSSTTASGSASAAVHGDATSDSQSSETVTARSIVKVTATSDATSSTTGTGARVLRDSVASSSVSDSVLAAVRVLRDQASSNSTSSTTAVGFLVGSIGTVTLAIGVPDVTLAVSAPSVALSVTTEE